MINSKFIQNTNLTECNMKNGYFETVYFADVDMTGVNSINASVIECNFHSAIAVHQQLNMTKTLENSMLLNGTIVKS